MNIPNYYKVKIEAKIGLIVKAFALSSWSGRCSIDDKDMAAEQTASSCKQTNIHVFFFGLTISTCDF